MSEDYHAVYGPKGFKCHVFARDKAHALKIARDQGLTLPRGSYARHIGRSGYYAALASVFKTGPVSPSTTISHA